MLIRKIFSFQASHIVRNCSTRLCRANSHGHSFLVEVFFTSKGVDNGQMILDFSLTKGTIKDFIESFDHAHTLWNKEVEKFKQFYQDNFERVVTLPCSPSAEMYSLLMFYVIDKILENTTFSNGEKEPKLHSVRVHETATGYAEAFTEDLEWWNYSLEDIQFSEGVKVEWKDPQMWDKILTGTKFINPIVEQQIV
jgi:6-pyruvoyltetrahydropterin/6-carboxytetrahydropterin synthase